MKRLFGSLAVVILAMGVLASAAAATHSNGEGPDKDFADGSAKLPLNTGLFGTFPSQQHINAQSTTPLGGGGATTGMFFTRIFASGPICGGPATCEEDLQGPVRCLDAVNNQEIDRGLITSASGPIPVLGFGVLGKHIDNGEPGADSASPDLAGGTLFPPPPPNVSCPPGNTPFSLVLPVQQGNFIVHDGI
jgi:hypothetical protein